MTIQVTRCLVFALLLSAATITSGATAESVPPVTQVTPDSAAELGFSVTATIKPGRIEAEMLGPEIAPNGCSAYRSGAILLDRDGKVLMVISNRIHRNSVRPLADGYYTDESHSMMLWIDYFCPPERLQDGRRYSIPSISAYAIDSIRDEDNSREPQPNKAMKTDVE